MICIVEKKVVVCIAIVCNLLYLCCNRDNTMSQNPKDRNKDSKEVAEDNIEKSTDNEDPTETVEASGTREEKGAGTDSIVL
jgi:hypothetical protein